MALLMKVTQVVTGVAGSPYYLTGYFTLDGGTAQAAADDWAAFVRLAPSAVPAGARYAPIAEIDVIESTTGQAAGVSSVSVAESLGTSGADFLPPANQALVRWRTGTYLNGREVRGRTNIPMVKSEDTESGEPSSGYIIATNTRATQLIESTDSQHCVYARTSGTFALTQSGTCWEKFAVLRSRRD